MTYKVDKVNASRWGIYAGPRLLATIGCPQTLDTIVASLSKGRNKVEFVAEAEPTIPSAA